MKLTAKAAIGIRKPATEIFEAIVNPEIMSNFFISKGSGRMETGAQLQWQFPEFDGSYAVSVKEVLPNKKIVFSWDTASEVVITFEEISASDTVVRVEETGHNDDDQGIKWAIGQTEGWANFLACMKAWLEYGVPLRKGAFDFMKAN